MKRGGYAICDVIIVIQVNKKETREGAATPGSCCPSPLIEHPSLLKRPTMQCSAPQFRHLEVRRMSKITISLQSGW
ncbi:hypothetical protein XELAEV_18038800mg [Xenopus laevis]|uniref:Uncharacterized protein n=1 Tax=Xenopus laevis TaxID=8355 RepID=A0A974H7A4_XENLA|nr:hypothetical protein XELAEV_18038800mg [Xenopus laevis]